MNTLELKVQTNTVFALLGLFATSFLATLSASAQSKGSISGEVVCSDTHTPARFAIVRAVSAGFDANTNGYSAATQTGPNGAFLIENLPPGPYVIDVALKGYLEPLQGLAIDEVVSSLRTHPSDFQGLSRVSVTPNNSARAQVLLIRGSSISGIVSYDDGGYAQNLKVTAISTPPKAQASSSELGAVYTDDSGRFRITGLAKGSYTVRVDMPDGVAGPVMLPIYLGDSFRSDEAKAVSVALTGETTGLAVKIPVSTLRHVSGIVPVTEGHPLLVTLVSSGVDGQQATLSVFTDREGRFIFPGVPPGPYTLRATLSGKAGSSSAKPVEIAVMVAEHDVDVPALQPNDSERGGPN